jgi:predicted Zn finger-like uncharacterized protein
MYSQCPDCQARFRVTAAQLRAARGTVRCGRCGGAFDALARLSDSLPKTQPVDEKGLLPDDADELAAAAQSGVPPEYHFSAADLEKVFIEARDWSPPRTDTPVFESDNEPEELIVEEPEQIEDITLEGERIALETIGDEETADAEDGDDADEAFEPSMHDAADTGTPLDYDLTGDVEILDENAAVESPARPAAPSAATPSVAAPSVAAPPAATLSRTPPVSPRPEAGKPEVRDWPLPPPSRSREQPAAPVSRAASSPLRAAERWSLPASVEEVPQEEDDDGERRRAILWRIGSVALALLLALQLLHHYRERLARNPGAGPAVRAFYDAIGVPIGDAWDLDAFELRQWGAGSDLSAGRLNVRASVTNRAEFAQPLPLLRVEIEDRFGAAVAIRDFQPSEYLKNPARVGRLLATGESADAQLDIVAASVDGVGYRLNVCMRDVDGSVHCASAPG